MRMIDEVENHPRAIVGRIMCAAVSLPELGRRPSARLNTCTSRIPVQNDGVDCPIMEIPTQKRSRRLIGLTAEKRPG